MLLHTTPQERLALGVTALLLAAGAGVRVAAHHTPAAQWHAPSADTPESIGTLRSTRARADAQARRDSIRARPLRPGERIDPNAASEEELDRLPRVGPALARRIVQWRESRGRFRTLADLDSVSGVGPALLAALAPRLTLPAAPAAELRHRSRSSTGAPQGMEAMVHLNQAGATELDALPGIGPALAARIVEWRAAHGPFRSLEQLDSVHGIGPSLRRRLAPRLRL